MITLNQARDRFTQTLQAVYDEKSTPTAFLRSFFTTKESDSRQISIEVRRGKELIAVDVERGTEGNRNSFGKSSQKVILPPYYYEYFDATDLDFYDMLFTGEGSVHAATFAKWLSTIVGKITILEDMIHRSYELQCSQVIQTGIVTLNNGTNIDFKRKAASLVDLGAGNYWTTGTVNPYLTLESGANFVRQKGKSQGNILNVIMGATALSTFLDNPFVKERAEIRNFALDQVRAPQRDSVGGTLHGEVSSGSYKFRLWTYPEYYDTKTVENNSYIDPKNIIIIPENPKFILSFAAVPRLLSSTGNAGAGVAGQKGAFLVGEFLDQRNVTHNINVKSAGVAVPVSIDQLYTAQVIA